MTTILGLDQSITNTAVCIDGVIHTITTKPKDFAHKLDRLETIRQKFMGTGFSAGTPGVAYVEGYGFGSQVAHTLGELGGMLQLELWRRGWSIYLVPPSTLKKFVTGKGNAEKSGMMLEVFKRWGHSAKDDNDADAFALYAFGVLHQMHLGGDVDGRVHEHGCWKPATKDQQACFAKIQHLPSKGVAA